MKNERAGILDRIKHSFRKLRRKARLEKKPSFEQVSLDNLTEETILKDMKKRREGIQARGLPFFDLTDSKWEEEENARKFLEEVKYSDQIRVPHDLEKWLIGQKGAVEFFDLIEEEWKRCLKRFDRLDEAGIIQQRIETGQGGIMAETPPPLTIMAGPPGCYTGDTRIILKTGQIIELKDIARVFGDVPGVYPLNLEICGLSIDRATQFHIYPNQDVYALTTYGGRKVYATPNNPFLTSNGWRELASLKPEESIRIVNEVPRSNILIPTNWKRKISNRPTQTRQIACPSIWTEELAGFLGAALAEGTLRDGRLKITVRSDEMEFIEYIKNVARICFGIELKEKRRSIEGRTPILRLRYNSIQLAEWLSPYLYFKRVPLEILSSPNNVLAACLRTLFEGDGSVSNREYERRRRYKDKIYVCREKDRNITLKNVSPNLLRDVQLGLLKFAVKSRIYKASAKYDVYVLKICDILSLQNFKQHIDFLSERKKHTLSLSLENIARKCPKRTEWEKVKSIEYAGKRTVYDLHVPSTKALVVNGIIGHNTGKTLTIKIWAQKLAKKYKEWGVKFKDTLLTYNKRDEYRPFVHRIKAGMGKRILKYANEKELKKRRKRKAAIKLLAYIFGGTGALIMGVAFKWVIESLLGGSTIEEAIMLAGQMFGFAGSLFLVAVFVWALLVMGAVPGVSLPPEWRLQTPNLLIDNTPPHNMFEDATGREWGAMYGEVEWTSLGPDLGKIAHKRIKAGKIPKAHQKMLYKDQLESMINQEIIEMLTIGEDGFVVIKSRPNQHGIGGTASQMAESPPIPCLFWFVGACNEPWLLNPKSPWRQIPAFRDRLRPIFMESEVDDTAYIKLKYFQAFADECYRIYDSPPLTRDAMEVLYAYCQRKASSRKKVAIRFRPIIKTIKMACNMAWRDGKDEIDGAMMQAAVEKYSKGVIQQLLEKEREKRRYYKLLDAKGMRVGLVHGLGVSGIEGEMVGEPFPIASIVRPLSAKERETIEEKLVVTGADYDKNKQVYNSIQTALTMIDRLYGINSRDEYFIHVDFVQQSGVQGESAGAIITLSLMSWFGDPDKFRKNEKMQPTAFRQNIAMTGTVESLPFDYSFISNNGKKRPLTIEDWVSVADVQVGPIGAVIEKIEGAKWFEAIEEVLVPKVNYEMKITERELKILGIKVTPIKTLKEAFKILSTPEELDWAEAERRLGKKKVKKK